MEDSIGSKPVYILRLYISGATPNSAKAVNNLTIICKKYLKGRYNLKIIDIYQQQDIAKKEEIIAVPLLIKSFPLPVKRLIGNLSDTAKVLKVLELEDELNSH